MPPPAPAPTQPMKNQPGLISNLIKLQKMKSDTPLLYTSVGRPEEERLASPTPAGKAGPVPQTSWRSVKSWF